ncbi:Sensitive to high expression protein 9-like protein [Yarrowia sp. C11]|nr:Sensitive to high expression protein 9-like protein [Yarrowia sp. E02]KAG5372310.1 Sensitive to high expression protein 9-like protein [Yarrowia sp. C11]
MQDLRESRKARSQDTVDDAAFRNMFEFAVEKTRDSDGKAPEPGVNDDLEQEIGTPWDPPGTQSRHDTRQEHRERFDDIKKSLPSSVHDSQPQMYKWFGEKMDQLQAGALTAGQTLNEVTGYKAIEKLKLSIEKLEDEVLEARAEVRHAKKMYSDAISERSNSQREVNELLQRKHNWSAADLERFTTLYRNDHANEHSVHDAKKRLGECEHHVEDLTLQLSKQILTRYHEEQIWSDKIRRASTWGTWILMGFNVVLFIVVQLGLEPWKRRRLVGSFEDKVKESLQEWEARNEARRMEEATMAATATQTIAELQRRIESPHVSKAAVVEAEAEINSIKTNLANWFKEREDEEKDSIAKEAHQLAVIAEDPDMTDVQHEPHPPQPVDTERVVRPKLVENFDQHIADPVDHPAVPIASTIKEEEKEEVPLPIPQKEEEASSPILQKEEEASSPILQKEEEVPPPVLQQEEEAPLSVLHKEEEASLPVLEEKKEASPPRIHPLVHISPNTPDDGIKTFTATKDGYDVHPLVTKTYTPPHFMLRAWEAAKLSVESATNKTVAVVRSTYHTAVHQPSESTIIASLGGICGGLVTFLFLR